MPRYQDPYGRSHSSLFVLVVLVSLVVIFTMLRNELSAIPILASGVHMSTLIVDDLKIRVRIATAPNEREEMLGRLGTLPQEEGILMPFQEDGVYTVAGMAIIEPADIIWIDSNGFVVDMREKMVRSAYDERNSQIARYVLILHAGYAKKLGIEKTTYILIPTSVY